jgi:ribosome biogenesis GTPase
VGFERLRERYLHYNIILMRERWAQVLRYNQPMAKRRLTEQQRARIEKNQRKHQQAPTQRNETALATGQCGLVIANYGREVDVETAQQQVVRCHIRQQLGNIAVGDEVIYQTDPQDKSVIVAVQPRRSALYRFNKFEGNKLVAANVDQMLIVVAPEPARALNVLDRYLVLAHSQKIKPIILFNKIDLLSSAELAHYQTFFAHYIALGYPTLFFSTKTPDYAALQTILQGKNSIFVGVSGVGKSSLLQSLLPDASVEIGELSLKSQEGSHTTTIARLYHLPYNDQPLSFTSPTLCNPAKLVDPALGAQWENATHFHIPLHPLVGEVASTRERVDLISSCFYQGNIIDSPGIRELTLGTVNAADVLAGFPELAALALQCQFRNCSHLNEAGCAILRAEKNQEINVARLASMRNIIQQLLTTEL